MTKSRRIVENRRPTKQFFVYIVVGIASNALGYLVYLLITHLGLAPKLAMTILYGVCATAAFFGNQRLTFSYEGGMIKSGIRYLIAHSAGYLLNLAILVIFVDKLQYPHQLIQAIAIIVVAIYLFVSLKLFVFRNVTVYPQGENQ